MSALGEIGRFAALQRAAAVRLAEQGAVARLYAQRKRLCLAAVGTQGTGAIQTDNFEKVVLQKDFLNVVGGVDSQSNGLAEIEVTRDADGGMRFYAETDVHLVCKNTSGVTITMGTPVYVTGSVGATTTVEIAASDAGNAAKMPAIGLLEQTLAPNEFGRVVAVGVLGGLDTSAYSINQTAYVAVGGGLTGTRPTAATALVQNIGRVLRVNVNNGEILVLGAGRTNDVPNYTQARLLGRGSVSGAGPAQEITVGTGLTLSGTNLAADQDLFRAIVVAGQNTIYASGSDSLEFVAGSNITLTTDDTLKTVTIDATGGGGGAPTTADYLVKTADAGLSAERVVTDSTSITANWGTAGQVAFERAALTGDVTASANSNSTTIANDAVTYAKIQNVSATDKVLGRQSAGAGDVEEIACTSAGRALIDDVDAAAQRATLSAERQAGNRFVEIFDDLIAPLAWNGSTSGTGSARTTASAFSATENTVGMIACFTGTTTTGRASNYDGDEGLWFANGWTWMLETRACADTLADATNDYVVYLGFCDNNANANEPNDGAYFKYQRSVTGTFWVCSTANNGARTNTTTAVAPANLIMQVFKIDVNEAGTSVEFRIDGTLVATHTTNIPSASARSTGIGQKIVKSAGTSSRTLYVDYIHLQGSRTTDR